jgi:acyl carrier protein
LDPAETLPGRSQLTATLFEQVRGVASDVFGVPADRMKSESSPETVESWDSTQHLNFVLALEEKFGFQLSPEEMEQMRTVGDAAKVVENRLQGSPR